MTGRQADIERASKNSEPVSGGDSGARSLLGERLQEAAQSGKQKT